MSRRRSYDVDDSKVDIDILAAGINNTCANGSNYIEVARKFDDADYLWVAARNTNNGTSSKGNIYVFNSKGVAQASLYYSFGYIGRMAQIYNSTLKLSYMFATAGSSQRNLSLKVYCFNPNTKTITLLTTSSNVGNFCNNRIFVEQWSSNVWNFYDVSNSLRQTPFMCTITINSASSVTVKVSRSETSYRTDAQMIYHAPSGKFYSYTWNAKRAAATIGYQSSSSGTGYRYSTTTLSPYVNNYSSCLIFPIYYWKVKSSEANIEQMQKSLWWCKTGACDRKYLISDLTTGKAVSSSPKESWTITDESSSIGKSIGYYGILTVDGETLYTFDTSVMKLIKLNAKQ